MIPIMSHTYGLESKSCLFVWIYLLIDFDSKAYVCPRMEVIKYMFMEKVQSNSKYIFHDPHSEPYVWPRIEISIAKYMKHDIFF